MIKMKKCSKCMSRFNLKFVYTHNSLEYIYYRKSKVNLFSFPIFNFSNDFFASTTRWLWLLLLKRMIIKNIYLNTFKYIWINEEKKPVRELVMDKLLEMNA